MWIRIRSALKFGFRPCVALISLVDFTWDESIVHEWRSFDYELESVLHGFLWRFEDRQCRVPDVHENSKTDGVGWVSLLALRSLMFIKFSCSTSNPNLYLQCIVCQDPAGSRSEPSQRCSIAALVMVCMSLCSDVRREGPSTLVFGRCVGYLM